MQEWRPDYDRFGNRVALLQLASARTALLVRTCRMRFALPPALVAFLRRVCVAPGYPNIIMALADALRCWCARAACALRCRRRSSRSSGAPAWPRETLTLL